VAKYKILVIEDDDLMQGMLKEILIKNGYHVTVASDGLMGWELFRREDYDFTILDLKLPKINGISLLKKIREKNPEAMVCMITAYGTIDTAVDAMKLGAFDYLTKPFLEEELVLLVKKGLEIQDLRRENYFLRQELDKRHSFCNLTGGSEVMQRVYQLIDKVAPTNAAVLIHGESGTGKEVVAEAICRQSLRKNRPMIKVSCAALPESLLESELFGYEKGAFTSAYQRKAGRFELADKGTIFLDEVDDMAPAVQVRLLRVLQEKQFERLGGTETINVDVRVIAASKTDLMEVVKTGKFRADLYYRLNVVPIYIPPLRERREDIPLLVKCFLEKFCKEVNKKLSITPQTLRKLTNYSWPGNIRELQNMIERLVTLVTREKILPGDLPDYFMDKEDWRPSGLEGVVQRAESKHIRKVLESTSWQKTAAARILGISPKNLWEKIRKYKIE